MRLKNQRQQRPRREASVQEVEEPATPDVHEVEAPTTAAPPAAEQHPKRGSTSDTGVREVETSNHSFIEEEPANPPAQCGRTRRNAVGR